MNDSARSLRIPRVLVHHAATVGCLAAAAFVVQSSLVPYDFASGEAAQTRPWLLRTSSPSGIADIVSNILLYTPLGYMLTWCLRGKSRRGAAPLVLNLAAAAMLSLTIEAVQHWLPSRVSSLVDVMSNLVGAGVGGVLALGTHAILPKLIGATTIELKSAPKLTATKAYFLLLAICATAPFSFSIDAGMLREAAKNAVIVPFSHRTLGEWVNDHEIPGPLERPEFVEWREWKRWARFATEATSFAIFGALLLGVLLDHYRFERFAAAKLALWMGGLLAILLSGLQLLVVSRGFDAGDIASRWLGLAGGVTWGAVREKSSADPQAPSTKSPVWPVSVGLCVLFIVYCGLIPFRWVAGAEGLGRLLEPVAIVPFLGYFETRYDRVMEDVIEKMLAFAILAAVLCKTHEMHAWPIAKRPVHVCVVLCALVELGQAFNPVRVPSVTDLLLALGGGWLGVWAYSHIRAIAGFSREADAVEMLEPPMPQPRIEEALLAQLSQPHPAAPQEIPNAKRPRQGKKARSRGRQR